MGRDSLGLAAKSIEGGLGYAQAALSEGYCPTCRNRLKAVPEDYEISEDPYPSPPQARGFCEPCFLVWTAGEHREHLDLVAGPGWLTIDDNYDGTLRRMSFNPAPDPDDYDEEDDDDYE
jgi:hypothetical protein